MTSAITWAFPLQHQPSRLIPQLKKDSLSFAFSIDLLLVSLCQWLKTLLFSMLPTWHDQLGFVHSIVHLLSRATLSLSATSTSSMAMIWILKNIPIYSRFAKASNQHRAAPQEFIYQLQSTTLNCFSAFLPSHIPLNTTFL